MSDTLVFDLLAEWEEHRQNGKSLTPEQLCPDNPVVQEKLRHHILRQQRVRDLIEPTASTETSSVVPQIEGFEVLDVIGNGGMGIVYRAKQFQLERIVALKMILTGDSDRRQLVRFRDEARAVAALQHPNIVQVYESGESNGRPYLVLEYIEGGSLARHLNGAPVAPKRAAELVAMLSRAVQHSHERGIIHRDLKPANVLLTADGTPKITDFGLAKRLDEESGQTRTGVIVGSPSYMPPEQAAGHVRAIGPATDVYALGAILYELLTGRPPFIGETVLETIRQVSEHPPVEPRALQPSVPKDLEIICLKCLEKRPSDRYESAAALAADIEHFLAGEPIDARPPTVLGRMARNLQRENLHPGFAKYSVWAFGLAPIPLVVHSALYFAFRDHRDFPFLITVVSMAVIVLLQFLLHMGARPAFNAVPASERRHFVTVWSAEVIGSVLIWFLVWAVVPPDHPELMFLVYPLWAQNLGHTYLAFASENGSLYVQGGLFFLLAICSIFVLQWMPLIIGVLMFTNMTVSGLMMRRGWKAKAIATSPYDSTIQV